MEYSVMVKNSKVPLNVFIWKHLQDTVHKKFKVYNGVIKHYYFAKIK